MVRDGLILKVLCLCWGWEAGGTVKVGAERNDRHIQNKLELVRAWFLWIADTKPGPRRVNHFFVFSC